MPLNTPSNAGMTPEQVDDLITRIFQEADANRITTPEQARSWAAGNVSGFEDAHVQKLADLITEIYKRRQKIQGIAARSPRLAQVYQRQLNTFRDQLKQYVERIRQGNAATPPALPPMPGGAAGEKSATPLLTVPAVGFKQKSSDTIRNGIHGSLRDLFDAAYGDVFQVSAAAAANPDQKTEEPEPKDKKPSKK